MKGNDLVMKKIDRKEFFNCFVNPFLKDNYMKKEHPFEFYWSGKDADKLGYKLKGAYGKAINVGHKRVVLISFRTNQLHTFKTFIHEIGHIMLKHYKVDTNKYTKCRKEIEAETVTKRVFLKLSLPYEFDYYIDGYMKDYIKLYGCDYYFDEGINSRIDMIVDKICSLIGEKVDVIKELPDIKKKRIASYKYKVICPFCNSEWLYKKQTKLVKRNGIGFYCVSCGKKSTNKLIVENL